MGKQKVLIIAGGGFFGLVPVCFLSFLGSKYDFLADVNTLSGTSIGGIEASIFASGALAGDVLKSFVDNGADIFQKRFWAKVNPLAVPMYDSDNLSKFVKNFVGDKLIKDIRVLHPNLNFFVPCLNMTQNQLKVFDNVTGKDDYVSLLDVGLFTSAAPTYFPVINVNGDAITDGGVRENIPIVTTATGLRSKCGIEFKDMDVLVLCTGKVIDKNCGSYDQVSKWNLIDWALKFIVPNVTNGNESMSQFWGNHLGFNSFEIFNPIQIKGNMDDPTQAKYLLEECVMYKEKFLSTWEKFIQ